MTRTVKLSMWGALIVLASQLNATVLDSSFNVNVIGSKALELTMANVKGNLKISLLNTGNGVLYSEEFTNSGSLKKIFDLGLIPDGNYKIQLLDSQKTLSFPISIEDNILSTNTLEKSVHFLAVVTKKNNRVSVNMPAFEEEYLDISILNSMNEVVYENRLKGKDSIGKIFDFSNTYSGKYQIHLMSKAGLVSKEIKID